MRRRGSSQVVLIDFGLARGFIPDITQSLTAWHTPAFAPPEQFIEQGRPGAYTDVYALAATLYYLLTKTLPTAAPMRALNAPLKPPGQVNPDISDRVHKAILQGMVLDEKSRPQSMPEWLAMLTQVSPIPPTVPIYPAVPKTSAVKKSPDPFVAPVPLSLPPVKLISAFGVDYRQLEKLLSVGDWKMADWESADWETRNKMLEVMGRTEEHYLRVEDIDNFPCEDLRTINQLWVQYSNGRFGFSVQKRIYQSLGGTRKYDEKIWEAFCDRVGWRKYSMGSMGLVARRFTFTTAPPGHLPHIERESGFWVDWGSEGVLLSRRDL